MLIQKITSSANNRFFMVVPVLIGVGIKSIAHYEPEITKISKRLIDFK